MYVPAPPAPLLLLTHPRGQGGRRRSRRDCDPRLRAGCRGCWTGDGSLSWRHKTRRSCPYLLDQPARPAGRSGPRRDLRLAPFGPAPGVAAMTVLVSHVGTCYLGVNVDIDAVREPELFDACLHQGFAMVLSLAQERWPTRGSQ